VLGMPAIEIGDHCDGRVADLCLSGELRLGHVGHSDHVAMPGAVELTFGEARKLRPLHDDIGAAALQRHAGSRPGRDQRVADAPADRMRHRNMGHTAPSEKALRPREGPVDKLVDDDEIAGDEVLAQAADRGQGYDIGHTAALQRIDIGAEIDLRRRQHVPAPVAWNEHDGLAVERAETEFVGRGTEGRCDRPPLDIVEPVDPVDPAAPDNSDKGPGHTRFSGRWPRSCASPRRTPRQQPRGTASP
jgi:hypothetical protein